MVTRPSGSRSVILLLAVPNSLLTIRTSTVAWVAIQHVYDGTFEVCDSLLLAYTSLVASPTPSQIQTLSARPTQLPLLSYASAAFDTALPLSPLPACPLRQVAPLWPLRLARIQLVLPPQQQRCRRSQHFNPCRCHQYPLRHDLLVINPVCAIDYI